MAHLIPGLGRCMHDVGLFILDTRTLAWSIPTPWPTQLQRASLLPGGAHSACVVGDQLLIVGGGYQVYNQHTDQWAECDIETSAVINTNNWTVGPLEAPDLPSARSGHSCTLLHFQGTMMRC